MPKETLKNFDSRRFVQLVRAKVDEETKGMSPREVAEYYRTYPYDAPHEEIDATRLPWWGGENGERQESGRPYFDCIEFTRQARREIYEETKRMSMEELHEYWRKFRETDPFWQRLTAIEAERSKQVPSGGRRGAENGEHPARNRQAGERK